MRAGRVNTDATAARAVNLPRRAGKITRGQAPVLLRDVAASAATLCRRRRISGALPGERWKESESSNTGSAGMLWAGVWFLTIGFLT